MKNLCLLLLILLITSCSTKEQQYRSKIDLQNKKSIIDYMQSDDFNQKTAITIEKLKEIL